MMTSAHWIAHRGYQLHYPENSALSIQAALACGAQWIEIDVQLTADRIPVIVHDVNSQRVSDTVVCVLHTEWQQLRQICNGEPGRFGRQFQEARFTPLHELAELLTAYPQVQCLIELKRESIKHFGVACCLQQLRHALAAISQRCVLISFDCDALAQANPRDFPRIAPVLSHWQQRKQILKQLPRAEMLICNHRKINTHKIQCELPVAVYEVANFQQAQALYARGATLIETFAIGEMLAQTELAMQTAASKRSATC